MYWLLSDKEQQKIRIVVDTLVEDLSKITGNPQSDQLFPYVGRKGRRKAESVIKNLTKENQVVTDPFAGSGSFVYAAYISKRRCLANEWEPYAYRMGTAPWRLPKKQDVGKALDELLNLVQDRFDYLYRTICKCGHVHVLDTLFFDRDPLNYRKITPHERLGTNGENITYRGSFKCPKCERTEKHFNYNDEIHIREISAIPVPEEFKNIFDSRLIENSRINLTTEFTRYGNLFPHRSKIALCVLWEGISSLKCKKTVKAFLIDAFLSILPQAKFKDYRSKSQDLHCPREQLREVNILNRYLKQVEKRFKGLKNFPFSLSKEKKNKSYFCLDFRKFLKSIKKHSVHLILTDPPWTDGNAYFEKAQLYHPWLNYNLSMDKERLSKELVVTDAPERKNEHNLKRWWEDISEFFKGCNRILGSFGYLALFFRPVPASKWLTNLNNLKLEARKVGFEPLLSIDVASSDPSMRIQQSAAYVFSQDVIILFVKLPTDLQRLYFGDLDIDQIVFQAAEEVQEYKCGPFSYKEWRGYLGKKFDDNCAGNLNLPKWEKALYELLKRYCDEVSPGQFLPKALTPFSGQLFDIPAEERLFTYIPLVINEITKTNKKFSYDRFLLRLSGYVENGTRMLIDQIEQLDIKKMIEPYAVPIEGGRWFRKRKLPKLPEGLKNVLELDPYEFEVFVGKLLEAKGFTSVSVIGRSGDRGVDVVGRDTDGGLTVIQCKRYLRCKVSASPIQRLHSFSVTRGAERRIIITTSGFTPAAEQEAALTDTELINGTKLESLISNYLPNYF